MAKKYDESKFKPLQREAAVALVEYEFTPKGQRLTKQEIADELGVTRKTLHNWDTKDANFIAYKSTLADEFLDTRKSFVYAKLIDSIDRGSVRGMELYMKRLGDLDTKSEITINDGTDDISAAERKEALKERLAALRETNGK